MSTITDVAERAGVSITTVSHVINETRYVSDELTKRVYEAMRELNYRPNTLARSLRSGRTKTIGLVIPDISNMFFAEISRKIEDKGFEYEFSVILCNTDDDPKKEESYINVLLEKQVDGIIFISAGGAEENLEKSIDLGIPTIVADRDMQGATSDVVLVDNLKGGYDAAKYRLGAIESQVKDLAVKKLLTEKQNVESMKSPEESTEIDLSGAVEQLFGDMPTTTPIKPSPLEEEKK